MTSYRNLVILLLATVMLCPTAGAARPSTDRSGGKIIEVLKRSRLPLAEAGGECRDLAEHYPTLGKLVAAHDKLATRERLASCKPKGGEAGVQSCEAQFSNEVPSERSEEEFTLRLEFEMKGQTVQALRCFLAG
jgi:hypothetical protein